MKTGSGRVVLGVVLGAVLGLGLGAAAYAVIAPALEAAGEGWRDLQGFAWNAVPMGLIAGAVLGGVVATRTGHDGEGG